MIYTTFKQWAEGQFLEHGEPRKQAYSEDELALVEMGWGYGYDAGVQEEREACAKVCEALDPDMSWSTATDCATAIRARGQQ
jgi:hypothetical protein